MGEPVKKKRRLLIVDADENISIQGGFATPVTIVSPVTIIAPVTIITGPGPIHSQTQKEILALCREARFDEEKIDGSVWNRVDLILGAKTLAEAEALKTKALDRASEYFTLRAKKPEKQALAAERIAKMYRNKGDDKKADQQLEKAKKIRAEIAVGAKKA